MPLMTAAFHIATLLIASLLLIAAAVNDANHYRIPNLICGALVLLFPVYAMTAPSAIEWDQHLMVFVLVLISGFAMFIGHLAGGGDIKLLAATSLWAGPHYIAMFLIVTAVAGGFVALTMAGLTWSRNYSGKQAIAIARVPIPYGIAIAIGGLTVIYMTSQPILFPG